MYEPAFESGAPSTHENLDEIAHEILQFQESDDERFLDDLLAMNGSSAGARPKILIRVNQEDWIVKFRSNLDLKDVGSIEYAYHLMAKAAHLDVPEAKLFSSSKGAGYFGVKRFDRAHGKSLHMHSVSGLLHVDHRIPSLDYETLLKATLWLTKDSRECEKQFRSAVFNVLTHNRDDHAKNFSFLMDEYGVWRVSPSYDLTFSSGPAGEHCSTIMGEGKNLSLSHFLKLAEKCGIKKQKALHLIDEVKHVVSDWKNYAKNAGVSRSSLDMVQRTLAQLAHSI